MHVRKLIAEDCVVVCLSDGTMQGRTGMTYNNSYAFVFRFRGSQIAGVTEYLDTVPVETALFGRTIS